MRKNNRFFIPDHKQKSPNKIVRALCIKNKLFTYQDPLFRAVSQVVDHNYVIPLGQ